MNKKQVNAEYLELLNKKLDEENKIIQSAKEKGIWEPGLDSNRELFTELDAEFERKVEALRAKYLKMNKDEKI